MTVREGPVAVTVDGPTVGLASQFVVLAALAAVVGLGTAGWLAGAAFAVGTWVLLGRGLRRSGMVLLGPANQVTMARATLVGGVTALVADSFTRPVPVVLLVTLAAVGLVMDGVDGQVARRTGTSSELGARFDMEVDSFLVLALSVFVAGPLGWWVLTIGLMRYLFVAAAQVLPWLQAGLPPRYSRKIVAVVQGVALVVASAGVLPWGWNFAVVAAALGTLLWSFARDAGWLWRARCRY